MYIDFIDMLRNIQNGVYPQVLGWRDETEQFRNEAENFKNEAGASQVRARDNEGKADAAALDAESWANQAPDEQVINYTWNETADAIESAPLVPTKYSARHWAKEAEKLAKYDMWKAEAAQLTACSFSNEAVDVPVKVYTSNGDGTYTVRSLEYVFSALHYRQDTEQLTGHKRWVESQTAMEGQAIFGFQKNINHADVYVNGARQVEGACYTRVLKDIHFNIALHDTDVVTVSGMEAITGDEFQTILEENQEVFKETQKLMWNAEASEKTAESFVSEPVDVFVKNYISNDDGTFTIVPTTLYSALHWSVKMNMLNSYIVLVDTYHDLELLNVNDAKLAYVRGGFDIDDGRQGIFDYDASKSGINNKGTIISGWVRQYTGPMNVMWFPIKANQVADDTLEIQKALQWDTNIYFPENKYIITDTIEFADKKVTANNARFLSHIHTGIAVSCKNMKYENGIFGHLIVDWVDNDKDVNKISFKFDDCVDAHFSLSSLGGTRGISLEPEFGDVSRNQFKINFMINNTISISLRNSQTNAKLIENTFNHGIFENDETIYDTDIESANACNIQIQDGDSAGNRFILQKMNVRHNDDGKFVLFRMGGIANMIQPMNAEITNNPNIFGYITGKDCILDARYSRNLVAYIRDEDGVVSNIDVSAAIPHYTILGESDTSHHEHTNFERTANNPKALYTLENLNGFATYYPAASKDHELVRMNEENGPVDTVSSAYRTKRYNSTTKNKSEIANDFIRMDNEVDYNFSDKVEVNIYDQYDRNRSTKLETVIADSHDTQSLIANKTSLTINENPNTAKLVKNDLLIDDEVDFSHLSQLELKINDAIYSLTADKKRIAITNGIVDYYVDMDNAIFTDGQKTNERTAEYVEIIDGTRWLKETATDIDIDDDVEHTNITATHTNITDGTDTSNLDKLSLDISDTINTHHLTKISSKIFDAIDSNFQTKTDIKITNSIDTTHLSRTIIEVYDSNDANENSKTSQKIYDSSDSNESTKIFSMISDNVDTNKNTKTDMLITDLVDTYHSSKTIQEIYDVDDKNENTKLHSSIYDNTNSNTLTKETIIITDGIDTNSQSKTEILIGDTNDSSLMSKTKIKIKDAIDSNESTKLYSKIYDSIDSSEISKTSLTIKDSTDTVVINKMKVDIHDSTNSNISTKENIIITDGIDTSTITKTQTTISDGADTLKVNKTHLHINDSAQSLDINKDKMLFVDGADSSSQDAQDYIVTDSIDTSHLSKTEIKINDSDLSFIARKDLISLTTSTATFVASANSLTYTDGDNKNTMSSASNKTENTSTGDTNERTSTNNVLTSGSKTNDSTASSNVIKDGADTNERTALFSEIKDSSLSNKRTKQSTIITDGTDTLSTTRLTMSISDSNDSSTVTKTKIEIANGSDKNTLKKDGSVVTDGSNTSTVSSSNVVIENGTSSTTIDKDSVIATDGSKTTTLDTDGVVTSSGGNTTTITSSKIETTDGTNVNTQSLVSNILTDGSSTLTTSNDEITYQDSSSKSTSIKNTILSFIDGVKNLTIDVSKIFIQDGSNIIRMTTALKSQIVRDDASDCSLEIKNIASGGRALDVLVNSGSDTAIKISDGGSSVTKITADENWTIANRKIIWSIGSAPTSGSWTIGDMAYNSTPSVGGKIGWVRVAGSSITGDTTSGSQEIVTSDTGLTSVGDEISGTGIPSGAIITNVDTANGKITISASATATGTGVTLSLVTWKAFGAIDA